MKQRGESRIIAITRTYIHATEWKALVESSELTMISNFYKLILPYFPTLKQNAPSWKKYLNNEKFDNEIYSKLSLSLLK